MARTIATLALVASLFVLALGPGTDPTAKPHAELPQRAETANAPRGAPPREPLRAPIRFRDSVALGSPEAGRLVDGVKLPPEGRHYFTWDPVKHESPSPPWRRWATDDLIRTVLDVVHDYANAHPRAPRVGIGDLSLPEGGYFGPEVGGGIGHATHQNGLDADLYYPLESGRERAPLRVDEIDLRLAQDLVDRFVAAGADLIYVGPNTSLTGPPEVVAPLSNHDNHLHVRIAG